MKKKILWFISVLYLIAGISIAITKAQPGPSYTAKVVIPSATETRKAIEALSQESDFAQAFPGVDLKSKNKKLVLTSAGIETADPAKGNLSMFRSIKIFLIKSDGSNEVLVASNTNIPPNATNKLMMNLNKQLTDKSTGVDPSSTIEQILSRLPGVTTSGGEIRVRGSDSAPLFVIDGSEKRSMTGVEPSDILTINVLKDASETGMYGVRGANGVIVVKTKSANLGVGKNSGSLGNFDQDSKVTIKIEYLLRAPLAAENAVNISLGYK